MKILVKVKGSAKSGNYGHAGRPGLVGGSGKGGATTTISPEADYLVRVIAEDTVAWQELTEPGSFFDQMVEGTVGEYDMSSGEYIAAVDANLDGILADCHVCIRVPHRILSKILDEGRIKSQFETGTSEGIYNPDLRIRHEEKSMGVPVDIEPAARPIYGYLTNTSDGQMSLDNGSLEQYGDVAIVLKDGIRERTTWLESDSLDMNLIITRSVPSPVNNPSTYSLRGVTIMQDVLYDTDPGGKLGATTTPDFGHTSEERGAVVGYRDYSYWEAQIHGGVNVSDIDKVVFWEQPSARSADKLSDANIPYEVVRKSE